MKSQTFYEKMEQCRILIWNSSEDEIIRVRIEPHGYNEEKLTEGKNLFNEVSQLAQIQEKEHAEQYAATKAFNEKWFNLEDETKDLLEICRHVFDNNHLAEEKLKLHAKRKRKYADWWQQSRFFYDALLANPSFIAELSAFAYTTETIQERRDLLDEINHLREIREQEKGDAQQATKNKDAGFEELKEWCDVLRDLVKILFKNDPQYLEKLGIFVRS